jgi:hypothetical protein
MFHQLTHGRIGLVFFSNFEVATILGGYYFWGLGFLNLKSCHPCFDPWMEASSVLPVLVNLTRFPLDLCTDECLVLIGNNIEKTIYVDKNYK